MPHQCLKCGDVFPDSSQELLKGCSKCNGRKFFYTQAPITKEKREELSYQTEKDIPSLIQNILTKEIKEDWITITKEEIKKVSQEMKEEKIKIKSIKELEKDFEKEEYKKEVVKKAFKIPIVREEKFLIPNIITKVEDGVYEINLKALMENVSIVMQKDGSYKVHLSKKFKFFK